MLRELLGKLVGYTYVTTSFGLSMSISDLIAYICKMAQSNVLNCTYPGTKLLNSYPCNFYGTIHWIKIIEHLSMGACVKARLHAWSTGSAEMQAKTRRLWLLLPHCKKSWVVLT